jgi:hypothetical protein|tara:strand:- start:56 stop:178 length:123 start_codon:yes stop_codon:yes gene_type:complete
MTGINKKNIDVHLEKEFKTKDLLTNSSSGEVEYSRKKQGN